MNSLFFITLLELLLYKYYIFLSLKAISPCVLWALDRACFNVIVKDAARKNREKYEGIMN